MEKEIEAEFLRLGDAVKFSGLSRSTLYTLMRSGKLASKCVRPARAIKGIRLISKQVLREFINGCPSEFEAVAKAEGGQP